MGTLLRHAPAPTATGVYHLETLNLETILMNSHKVSFAEPHRLWQILTGGVRFIWPSPADGVVAVSPAQLGYLLEGIDWRRPVRSWRPERAG